MNDTTAYTMNREAEYGGLVVVRLHGRKIGATQTPAGAALIRRNHIRQTARMDALLAERETQSDRDAWYDMDR